MDLKGYNFFCLDNKFGGERFEREGFEGISSVKFVNDKISPLVKRFKRKMSFQFLSLPSPLKQTNKTFLIVIPSFPFSSLPSPSLLFLPLQNSYSNILSSWPKVVPVEELLTLQLV